MWAEEEPRERSLDLSVSSALTEAMQTPPRDPTGGGYPPAGVEDSATVETWADVSRPSECLEVLPVVAGTGNPTVAPRGYDVARLPGDPGEGKTAECAFAALRDAVAKSNAACRKNVSAAAWHAEPIMQFLCSAIGDGLADVRMSDDNLIVITTTLPGASPVDVSIAVGLEGNCACRIDVGDTHLASTEPDARSFDQVLQRRLAEAGALGRDGAKR